MMQMALVDMTSELNRPASPQWWERVRRVVAADRLLGLPGLASCSTSRNLLHFQNAGSGADFYKWRRLRVDVDRLALNGS